MRTRTTNIPHLSRAAHLHANAKTEATKRLSWQPAARLMKGTARLELVRDALSQDNRLLWAANPAGARAKFEKLMTSAFVFFRGTAGLFYRDLKGVDDQLARVAVAGDVHPENFGAVKRANGEVVFDLNDFDESTRAPFTFDLYRGVAAFEVAARDRGFSGKKREDINEAFLKGYREAIRQFVDGKNENKTFITKDSATGVVKKLLTTAGSTRVDFLAERVDSTTRKFLETDEIKPQTERLTEFKTALTEYLSQHTLGGRPLDIRDVALKLDSGTASLGSQRYYLLVAHPRGPKHDVVLEVKQEGPSVLEPYVGKDPRVPGERVVEAHRTMSPRGDPFYGALTLGGESFIIRERQPTKSGVDLSKLDAAEMAVYARTCGAVVAAAHARSGRIGGKSVERVIKKQLDRALMKKVLDFAKPAADRVGADRERLIQLWKSGQFAPGMQAQLG